MGVRDEVESAVSSAGLVAVEVSPVVYVDEGRLVSGDEGLCVVSGPPVSTTTPALIRPLAFRGSIVTHAASHHHMARI